MSKINNWINGKIFSMKVVLKMCLWIANMTISGVSNKAGLRYLPNIELHLLNNFSDIDKNTLQKGADLSWLGGLTSYSIDRPGSILILISYEALRRDAFKNNPLYTALQILGLAGHEAFHSCQLEWLLENKGAIMFSELVNKVWQYNTSVDYQKNILEIGAETWGRFGKVQNFSDLSIILH